MHDLDPRTEAQNKNELIPSDVERLMYEIKYFDCSPSVFKVFLQAADHTDGFDAIADFRTGGDCSSVSSHADTPEDALEKLLKSLQYHFDKCPTCHGTGRAH